MDLTHSIIDYRRFLKRRNYSRHTVKNYLAMLRQFVLWLQVPLEAVTYREVAEYTDHLLGRRLKAKTINCHLQGIRGFYDYLHHEESLAIVNPVKQGSALRMPRPLPRHLRDEDVVALFASIKNARDRAVFKVMLRCGLRVEEVAALTLGALDLPRRKINVENGKGAKGRVVYISQDALSALVDYLRLRPESESRNLFLVEKGPYKGQGLSVRGIQKRIEYYAKKTGIRVSCHHLRHTMATQLLNANADIGTIQDLLGHNWITTTERYCTVSNVKVRNDYFRTMERLAQTPKE